MSFSKFKELIQKNVNDLVDTAGMVYEVDIAQVPESRLYPLLVKPIGLNYNDSHSDRVKDYLTIQEVYLRLFETQELQQYHNCSRCFQWLNYIGNLIFVVDGEFKTPWDIKDIPGYQDLNVVYKELANTFDSFIHRLPITRVYYGNTDAVSKDGYIGVDSNIKLLPNSTDTITFKHFYTKAPKPSRIQFNQIEKVIKFLDSLKIEHLKELLGYIDAGLEKGEQHRPYIEKTIGFLEAQRRKYQKPFKDFPLKEKYLRVFDSALILDAGYLSSSSISILLDGIVSEDETKLVHAERLYNKAVDPYNYRRSQSTISTLKIKKFNEFLEQSGYKDSILRSPLLRHELDHDVVYWSKPIEDKEDSLLDSLQPTNNNTKKPEGKPISYQEFIDLLPNVKDIELYVDYKNLNNYLALTNQKLPSAPNALKWDSKIAWTYATGTTSSTLRDLVKNRGGNISAPFLVRLAWNTDVDLDAKMLETHNGTPTSLISFENKQSYNTGGTLDVDANAGTIVPDPVENIYYPDLSKLHDGEYIYKVHHYPQRNRRDETSTNEFTVEYEIDGKITTLYIKRYIRLNEEIPILKFRVKNGKITPEILLDASEYSKGEPDSIESWGIKTNTWQPVYAVLPSPDVWGKPIEGGKIITLLENMSTKDSVIGIYNEFLKPEFREHRHVVEELSKKEKVSLTPDTCLGLGFELNKLEELPFVVRVTLKDGKKQQLKITK